MGKTRDLFKKTGDTKGTFQAKMGSIKDRNGKDLREAEDIKKRCQEYTELYKKGLNDLDNHNGVVTHLQPDILKSEVKALGSITTNKASGGNGIPTELESIKIPKDDAVKVLHPMCQQTGKLSSGHRTRKVLPGGSGGKESPCMQETWVQSLGREDSLEKETATHSTVLAWKIPWT